MNGSRNKTETTRGMDIQKLTEKYRERFDAYYRQIEEGSGKRKGKTKKGTERPNFLGEVIRPVLDALPDLLPEYGFAKTTDCYAMYGEYYRIKAGIVLVGGLSADENFGLVFTPMFHGKACGKEYRIDSMDRLVELIREQFKRREVKTKR